MDVATIYSLYFCGIIGFFIYFLVLFITSNFFDKETRPSSDVDDANDERRTRITDVTTDRSSEGMTANTMSGSEDADSDVPSRERIQGERSSEGVAANIMSSSDDTVFDIPSRERFQEERLEAERRKCIENASNQHTATDDDTEDEGDESDEDEEENRVFQTFVDEANLIQYTDKLGVLPGLMKYINENIQIWKTRKLKIAIIGNSGTGKSSLINAIRGLKPEDKGAAPVGVTETTMEKQEYVLPGNENISLWDLPGVGTQNFKKEDYLNAVNLKEFDAFMLVSASRFSENDVWLANEILKHESYIFFLRTKTDADLNNEKSDHPSTYNEAICLRKIKMDIVSSLEKSKFPQKRNGIYLVSSRESSKFDFPKLLRKLNRMLSKKRFAIRKELENYLKGILEKNRVLRKRGFFLNKIILFLVNYRLKCLTSFTQIMHEDCKIAFSLDDNTIKRISDEIGMSVDHLKTKELKYFEYFKDIDNDKYLKESLKTGLRIYGLHFPSTTAKTIFTQRLNKVCDVLAADEAKLIHLRLDHLEEQLRPF